jgi:nucleotide-binding universal stress UspA family protein
VVEFDEIVVPVDGSEGAGRAARFAARLAKATGCPLKLMYVFPATPDAIMGMARLSREEIEQAKGNTAREAFDKVRQAIGEISDTVDELVVLGEAAEEIIGYVDHHPDALIVMGRRGLSRMQTLMLGSVSEKVMRYARGAVTLVN